MIHCKRYLATAGDRYYPAPALGDFVGMYDTPQEALHAAKDKVHGEALVWVGVFDLLTMKSVAYLSNGGDGWIAHSQEIAEDGATS